MERIDVAQALIVRDERILVARSRREDPQREYWGLPGGRVEPGETLAEATIREAREEAGVEIELAALVALGEFLHETHHDFFVVFRASIVSGEPEIQPGELVVELRWVAPDEADALLPWYPGGVRALLGAREPLYYVQRAA